MGATDPPRTFALAIHGGAGLIRRNSLSADRERDCRAGLHGALLRGRAVLEAGGSALDAVTEAVVALEDAPVFNAGHGSVLTAASTVEMDAALADGRAREVGAVALVRTVRNPIRAARLVLAHTPHVLIGGDGADALAREHGLPCVDPSWFVVEERVGQLARARESNRFHLDHGSDDKDVYGTVGAVARDAAGHLAAATSTGGMVNKRPGRIGDTPLPGAGTFAWDRTCAVSATGHGEPVIRIQAAARVSALMELGGYTLDEATARVVHEELPEVGGAGGLIAVDAAGRIAMPFNTGGMFRGWTDANRPPEVAIW